MRFVMRLRSFLLFAGMVLGVVIMFGGLDLSDRQGFLMMMTGAAFCIFGLWAMLSDSEHE